MLYLLLTICRGVYLTDLVFIEDGNSNQIGRRFNFAKHRLVYNIVITVQRYQKFPYNLAVVPLIQQYFDNAPKLEEKKLFAMSLECEPRSATRNDIV
jgi:hypothetical protein